MTGKNMMIAMRIRIIAASCAILSVYMGVVGDFDIVVEMLG